MLLTDIPSLHLVLLSVIYFVSLCVSLYDFVRVFRNFRNKLPAFIPLVLCMIYYCLLELNIFVMKLNNGSIPEGMRGYSLGWFWSHQKLYAFLLIYVIAMIIGILSICHTIIKNRNELSLKSVKEAFDKLSTGLCYSAEGGYIILINKKMQELSVALTGNTVTNAQSFYESVHEKGDVIRFSDDSIFMFRLNRLFEEGEGVYYELIASDITEATLLREELQRQRKINEEFNERLARFSRETGEVTVKKEVLNAKMNIHDNLGNALILTKRYLSSEEPGMTLDQILDKWNRITFLEGTLNARKDKNIMDDIKAASDACGIELIVNGKIPNSDIVRTLLFNGLRETLTNALKHADASKVFIDISDDDGITVIDFTNDGIRPEGQVKEGGGLTSLRRLVENNGCEMIISNEDRFRLTLRIKGDNRNV